MKYKTKKTDILHNGKLYAEGSEIELNEKDAKRLKDFIDIIETPKQTASNNPKQTESAKNKKKSNKKQDSKTKNPDPKSNDGDSENPSEETEDNDSIIDPSTEEKTEEEVNDGKDV